MKKVLAAALLLVSGVVLARAQQDEAVISRDAQGEFTRGDYTAACRDFKALVERDPASAPSWSNYGVACHMAGQAQEAVNALQKALQLDPNLLPANLILGINYVKLERARDAVPLFNMVLAQQPDNRDALIDLASAHFALREFKAAADNFQRAVTLRSKDSDAWYGMGTSFEHIAEDTSRRLSSVNGHSSYFHHLVGSFLFDQGLLVDAEEAFQKALAVSSAGDEGLRVDLAFVLLRSGQLSKADQIFHQEIGLHPNSPMAWLGLAIVQFESKKLPEALEIICNLHRRDVGFFAAHLPLLVDSTSDPAKATIAGYLRLPQNVQACQPALSLVVAQLDEDQGIPDVDEIFFSLKKEGSSLSRALSPARVAHDEGRYTDCFHYLESLSPNSLDKYLLLARCACLVGRYAAAFEAADAAYGQDPSNPAALYWRAESARKLAQAAFAKAVSLSPGSWQGQTLLGDLYRQRKTWERAISHYSEAIRLKPNSPAPHLGLGAIYWETGQFDRAQPELEKVLQMDPTNIQASSELADILVRQHRFEEALPLLLKVAERLPDLTLTHANLGKVYAHQGKSSEAIEELLIALPSDPQGDLHYQLYSLYRKLGKTREAQQALRQSERLRAIALQQKQNRSPATTTRRQVPPQ